MRDVLYVWGRGVLLFLAVGGLMMTTSCTSGSGSTTDMTDTQYEVIESLQGADAASPLG